MALDCEMDQNTTNLTLEEIEEDHHRPGLVLKVSLLNMKGEIVLDTLVDYSQEPCQTQVKDHRVIFGRNEPITEQQTEKKRDRLKAKAKRRAAKQQVKENSPPCSIDKGYSTDTAVGSKRPNSKRVSFEKDESALEMPLSKKRKLDLSSKSLADIHGIQKELLQDAPTFLEVKNHVC